MSTLTDSSVSRRAGLPVGECVFSALLLLTGIITIVDSLHLPPSISASGIGADLMSKVVGGFLVVVSILLFVQLLRGNRGEPDEAEGDVDPSKTRYGMLFTAIAVIIVHGLLIEPAGFVVASTLTFWGIAFTLGSRRYLLDPVIGLVLSVAIYYGFTLGLGIYLPGLFEGLIANG
ncbi:tripartite tricarboxylate transporter TctB family protein [Pseudoclavibacter soli]|uniref:tripartite tricarboxylate transporter TctB family protein n=1 Tax=Pseudoclavibacter soli TaxID=452623 RepID=UPI000A022AE1|nr:tripartite tricarboxylate transporter TctB family protein [Pseudoclavibacter soli]